MRQFMEGIPDELIESAKIDGCGELRIFLQIIVPLSAGHRFPGSVHLHYLLMILSGRW